MIQGMVNEMAINDREITNPKTDLKTDMPGHCNGCANRCPITAMQCARGLKTMGFMSENKPGINKKPGRTEEGGCKGNQETQKELGKMLRACSNKLFIAGKGEEFFDVLSDDEKTLLEACLKRLLEQ